MPTHCNHSTRRGARHSTSAHITPTSLFRASHACHRNHGPVKKETVITTPFYRHWTATQPVSRVVDVRVKEEDENGCFTVHHILDKCHRSGLVVWGKGNAWFLASPN